MAEPDKSISNICALCGMKRRELKSGTITGWIFDTSSCRCDTLDKSREKQATTTAITCMNCDMPVSQSKKASITQWIFPSGKCKCERPTLNFDSSAETSAGRIKESDSRVSSRSPRSSDNGSVSSASALEATSLSSDLENPKLLEIAALLPERFTPLKYLGRGNVSVVCAAKDKYLGRVVAVKIFDQSGMDSSELMRFQSEAKIISRLDHPNIVQVFDFGITELGKPFMVLEYVDGTTLRDKIKANGRMSNAETITLFTSVASALAYAHNNGFSHRDLKPENLIIQTNSNDAKVIDFGLAKYVNAKDAFTTHTGISLIGTPPYMPPDQASGKTFDVRSEIYSYGCVLFETLTGRTPFTADTPLELISKHCMEPAPAVAELNPDVDEELSKLVQRCLNKLPDDRPQTFEEIIDILDNLGSDSSKRNVTSDVAEPSKRIHVLALTAGILLLSVIGTTLILPRISGPQNSKSDASSTNSDSKNAEPSSKSVSSLNDHVETFSLNDLNAELKDLKLVSSQNVSDLTPAADEVMLRVVSNVSTLRKADFSNSDITDKIAASIGGLDKISELKLDNCKITDVGLEQIARRSPNLAILSIANIAQLSKNGLKSLRKLPLSELNCDDNQLQNEDIKELSNNKAKKFELRNTGINDQNISFFESKTAEYLDLRNNKIGIDRLSTLLRMPSLKTIILSPTASLTQSKINSLKASVNSSCAIILSDHLPKGKQKELKEKPSHLVTTFSPVHFDPQSDTIELHGQLTNGDYLKILNYPQATRLNAHYLQSINVDGFKTLSKLPLQVVNLSGTDVDDEYVTILSGMKSLNKLVLSKTKITDAGLAQLWKLPNLEELILDGCNITDSGISALSRCPKLQRLSIKNVAQVSEKGIRSLAQLPLTNINFNGNRLTDDDVKAASQLKAVEYGFRNTGLDDRKVGLFNCRRALTIELTNNPIGPDGLTAILKLKSLVRVSLSPDPRLTPAKIEAVKKASNNPKCFVHIRSHP